MGSRFAGILTLLLVLAAPAVRAETIIIEIIDATGCSGKPLDGPARIAVDGPGNVYVAGNESDNACRITILRRVGTAISSPVRLCRAGELAQERT